MDFDQISDGTWGAVIRGTTSIRFEFLALQILLASLRNRLQASETTLADYLERTAADIRLPLVASYAGAMVNVSLKKIDNAARSVHFYATVTAGVEYRLARPVADYVAAFEAQLRSQSPNRVAFSCNCILNYFYCYLEGRPTAPFAGPITFGEIA